MSIFVQIQWLEVCVQTLVRVYSMHVGSRETVLRLCRLDSPDSVVLYLSDISLGFSKAMSSPFFERKYRLIVFNTSNYHHLFHRRFSNTSNLPHYLRIIIIMAISFASSSLSSHHCHHHHYINIISILHTSPIAFDYPHHHHHYIITIMQ